MENESKNFEDRRNKFLDAMNKSKEKIPRLIIGGEIKTKPSEVVITSKDEAILNSVIEKKRKRNQREKDAAEQNAEKYIVK